jgi:putative transposase
VYVSARDDKLLRLAIVDIEDERARERAARARQDGVRSGYPARLIEGQKAYGWSEALNELADAYPDRIQ